MALKAGEIMFLVGMEAGNQFQQIGDRITGIGRELQRLSTGPLRTFASLISEAAEAGGGGDRRFSALSKAVQNTSRAFKDLRLSIVQAVSPQVTQGLNVLASAVQQLARFMSENGQLVMGALAAAGAFAAFGTAIVAIGTAIATFGATVAGLTAAVGLLLNPVGAIITAIAAWQAVVLALMGTGFLAWVIKLGTELNALDIGKALTESLQKADFERFQNILRVSFQVLWREIAQDLSTALIAVIGATAPALGAGVSQELVKASRRLEEDLVRLRSQLDTLLGGEAQDNRQQPDRGVVRRLPLGAGRRVGTGPANFIAQLREQERARIRGRGGAFVMSLPASEIIGGSNRAGYAGSFAGRGSDVRGLLSAQIKELKEIKKNTREYPKFT